MKQHILIACLCALLAVFTCPGHAEEATRARLTGTWWGTITGEGHFGRPDQRWHWTVERKADGSYRNQTYRVDHHKKVYYAAFKEESGTWELKDGILQYIIPSSGRSTPVAVRWEDGKVRWEHKTTLGGIGGGDIIEECSEEHAKKYGPQLPGDYRQVTEAEFNARYAEERAKQAAEQAAADAIPAHGEFILPEPEPETPEASPQKPEQK